MTVYFAQMTSGDERLIKIGFSENVKSRLRTIAAEIAEPVTLLAAVDGSRETERLLHTQVADSRVHGEWFRPSEQVLALVKAAANVGQSWSQRQRKQREPIYHDSPSDDLRIVKDLLGLAIGQTAMEHSKSAALDELLPRLRAINPLWTLRRLRSIQNRETTSIALWMYRDLAQIVGKNHREIAEIDE